MGFIFILVGVLSIIFGFLLGTLLHHLTTAKSLKIVLEEQRDLISKYSKLEKDVRNTLESDPLYQSKKILGDVYLTNQTEKPSTICN